MNTHMKVSCSFITLWCFLLMPFIARAQELPPIQNYSSADYMAENQNWAISQGEDRF